MAYYGDDRGAPQGLFAICQEGVGAVKTWCKTKSDSVLVLALKAIHLHHPQHRKVIQDELKERRRRRKVQIATFGLIVLVFTLIVGVVVLVR